MRKILFVHAKGGVPLEHAVPRMAACGELHLLATAPLPTVDDAWKALCAGIMDHSVQPPSGEDLVDLIVAQAKAISADAVIAFSEYVLLAVSLAAERLGLRGPGADVRRSRDKRMMRERWAAAGVPVPRFRRVATPEDVRAALRDLNPPLLLKPAWGAGSVGFGVLRTESDVPAAWAATTEALHSLAARGLGERYETRAPYHLLVEEIINGTTNGWYDRDGYGDYLSVEGMVAAGTYHPIAITGRIPTIPPFTELSSHAPCALSAAAQRAVEAVARRAVDALGLETCGTHTEIKLCPDGGLMVVESAARLAGSAITQVVEVVYGVDLVGMLTRELLGEDVAYPGRMLVDGGGATPAAAEISLIGTDTNGVGWRSSPVWDSRSADLGRELSEGSRCVPVYGLTVPDGSRIPPYDVARGITNCAGMLFLTATDPHRLLRDIYAVVDGMEGRLNAAMSLSRAGADRP